MELFKMNAKEWPLLVFGVIGSFIEGAAFPIFAIFFGEILAVSYLLRDCSPMSSVECVVA